jgi:hypothetical protein
MPVLGDGLFLQVGSEHRPSLQRTCPSTGDLVSRREATSVVKGRGVTVIKASAQKTRDGCLLSIGIRKTNPP